MADTNMCTSLEEEPLDQSKTQLSDIAVAIHHPESCNQTYSSTCSLEKSKAAYGRICSWTCI